MDTSTIIGALMALAGVVMGGWSWVTKKTKDNAPGVIDAIQQVLDKLDSDKAEKDKAQPVVPGKVSREDAIAAADTLFKYFESAPTMDASDALQSIIKLLFSLKV
jgi:hypothetical protein